MSRDITRPIPLEVVDGVTPDGCCFSLDERGSAHCGDPVAYRLWFSDRQSSACPEHAAIARGMGVERIWSVTS